MKIGFVLCEHPLDIRIKKEARTLNAAGHEVVGLLQSESGRREHIPSASITVETYLPHPHSKLDAGWTFFKRMAFLRTRIESHIERFVVENKVDVLHVHDLPNVGPSVRVGRRHGIPIIADLHENYPEGMRVWFTNLKLHQKIITSPSIWHNYQKRCLQRADQVIVVIEESRDFMLGYGTDPLKMHVVPNYVDLEYLNQCRSGAQVLDGYNDRFIISYIGGIAPHRGLDTAVRSMVEVAKKAPEALLLIIGNDGDYTNYIRGLIKDLDLSDSVHMLGWQPFERVPDFVAASHVGLIPHHRNPQCDNTIPNKLFDYMGFEKPVVVSDCPPLRRIVEVTNSGLVFKAGDPLDLADQLLKLYQDRSLGSGLGQNGSRAVESEYNWDNASRELVALYEKLGHPQLSPCA